MHSVFELRFLRSGLPPLVFYTKKGLDYWLRTRKSAPHSFEIIRRPPHRGMEEAAIREKRANDGWLWQANSPASGVWNENTVRRLFQDTATGRKSEWTTSEKASLKALNRKLHKEAWVPKYKPGMQVLSRNNEEAIVRSIGRGNPNGYVVEILRSRYFEPGRSVFWPETNIRAHKRAKSPVRGAARQRLLKIHADVSRKLWAKSPGMPADMNERANKLSALMRRQKWTPKQALGVYNEVALLAGQLQGVVGTEDRGWKYIQDDLERAAHLMDNRNYSDGLRSTNSALQVIRGVLQRTTHGPRESDGYYTPSSSKIAYPVRVLNTDKSSGWVHVQGLGRRFRGKTFTIVGNEFTTYIPMGAKRENPPR